MGLRLTHRRPSMRFTLSVTITLMGLLGLGLALATGEIYRHLALSNQRAALEELLKFSTHDRLRELESRSRDFGVSVQALPEFRAALERNDPSALNTLLSDQFRQHFVSAEVLRLRQLILLDTGLNLLGAAHDHLADAADSIACPALLQIARQRSGPERSRILSDLCLINGVPRYMVLVPINPPRVQAYLAVVSDPVYSLLPIESRLGIPLKLTIENDQEVYRSSDWPPPNAMQNALVARYALTTRDAAAAVTVWVMNDTKQFQTNLQRTRYLVMFLAVMTTVLGVVLALIVLERSALQPLRRLTEQLRRVQKDRSHLGEHVADRGIAEVSELAKEFNRMTTELRHLYRTMEQMAFTDSLTRLPNRTRFHDSLQELTHLKNVQQPFALLLMDLDRFKMVNDTLGHHAGDQILQDVSERLRSALRGSDTVTRIDEDAWTPADGHLVARLGGDEFAAILPSVTTTEDAALVARKLIAAMESPFSVDHQPIHLGISIGIALYPQHGDHTDTLMRRADAAMYQAKHTHQGYAFYDEVHEQASLI